MGKASNVGRLERDNRHKIAAPDAIDCDCCTPVDAFVIKKTVVDPKPKELAQSSYEQKELVVIGAGPHALTLVLRLLEPEADLTSEKERHIRADNQNRMRPFSQVRKHIKNLAQGQSAVYKQSGKAAKKVQESSDPPPLTLDYVKENVLVVDGSLSVAGDEQTDPTASLHGWMTGWKKNFETLNIDQLRSPISAHADPFDHRSMDFFGDHTGRDNELVPLEHLTRENGRWDFHGPFNAPSTDLFHDFHRQLITGYGVQDLVKPGKVEIIRCHTSGQFELSITDPTIGRTKIVRTPRVVCAVGPAYRKANDPILTRMSLDPWQLSNRVLQGSQIGDFLAEYEGSTELVNNQSILIVGGGVTSAHLALTVVDGSKCPWCESATFIQRSKMKESQFDVHTAWMGPGRGNKLDKFWNLSNEKRAMMLLEERGRGSIHPEIVCMLKKKAGGAHSKLSVEEETEIMDVQYFQQDKLLVSMDDGLPPKTFDMIWLSTGFENQMDNYPLLEGIREELPVDMVQGLPVLNQDLSWQKGDSSLEEPNWKATARKRLWVMGPLAGLELGPDALNLMGARHGAVRVAKALRADICASLGEEGSGRMAAPPSI